METTLKKSKNTPKIPPTHKTTNPKHNEDYVFVEKPGEDFTGLKLISGPFASIVYKYGNVGFRPESEAVNGALPMVFDYTVIENRIEADTDSQEFIRSHWRCIGCFVRRTNERKTRRRLDFR